MNIRKHFNDDESAVSPVIGVILMVAITVILAAVIASFVLGMGPDTAQTPTATFDSQVDSNDNLVISMESGTTIDGSQVEVHVGAIASSPHADNQVATSGNTWEASTSETEVTAGDTITIDVDDPTDYEVRLVYVEGDTTSTLQTFED